MAVHTSGIIWVCTIPPAHQSCCAFDREVTAINKYERSVRVIHPLSVRCCRKLRSVNHFSITCYTAMDQGFYRHCPLCRFSTTNSYNWNVHLATTKHRGRHDGLACSECGAIYESKGQLTRHVKNTHRKREQRMQQYLSELVTDGTGAPTNPSNPSNPSKPSEKSKESEKPKEVVKSGPHQPQVVKAEPKPQLIRPRIYRKVCPTVRRLIR